METDRLNSNETMIFNRFLRMIDLHHLHLRPSYHHHPRSKDKTRNKRKCENSINHTSIPRSASSSLEYWLDPARLPFLPVVIPRAPAREGAT